MLDGLFGLGKECYVIGQETNPPGALVTTAVATGSGPVPMLKMDSFGAQLVVDPYIYSITHNAADSVTAASGTWHFVNGNFTAASVGATFTVAGASNSGNNGTFTILTYVSATNVTTAITGLTNETFGSGVTVSVNEASLIGTWKIEISNDVALNSNGGDLGQVPYAGHWTDMTSAFTGPAITAVTTSAATRNQYAQGQFTIRAVKFTFTSTAGRGYPLVIFKSKSWGR